MRTTIALILAGLVAGAAIADQRPPYKIYHPPQVSYPDDLVAETPDDVSKQLDWDNDWYIDSSRSDEQYD